MSPWEDEVRKLFKRMWPDGLPTEQKQKKPRSRSIRPVERFLRNDLEHLAVELFENGHEQRSLAGGNTAAICERLEPTGATAETIKAHTATLKAHRKVIERQKKLGTGYQTMRSGDDSGQQSDFHGQRIHAMTLGDDWRTLLQEKYGVLFDLIIFRKSVQAIIKGRKLARNKTYEVIREAIDELVRAAVKIDEEFADKFIAEKRKELLATPLSKCERELEDA